MTFETTGRTAPAGQRLTNPAPSVCVTVTFNETAWALAGIPHCPASRNSRGVPAESDGGPYSPLKPLPRVSMTRQGVRATKGRGWAEAAATLSADMDSMPIPWASESDALCADAGDQ